LVLLGHNYEDHRSHLAVFDFGLVHSLCHKRQPKTHNELSGYINFKVLDYFPRHDEEPICIGNIPSYFISTKQINFWKWAAAASLYAFLFCNHESRQSTITKIMLAITCFAMNIS
jgi:hypothetical protein